MHVDGGAGRLKGETNEPGWEVDPDDDWGVAVVETVGRQLKLRREAMGMRVADFAVAIGYGEDLVYKIDAGKRFPARSIWTSPTRCWRRAGSSRRPGRT